MSIRDSPFEICKLVRPAEGESEDCAIAVEHAGTVIIAVADGAGGTSGGRAASETLVLGIMHAALSLSSTTGPSGWEALLRSFDASLRADASAGETTAVALCVDSSTIVGASVGDSEAWMVNGDEVVSLTEGQQRKPLLGSGSAAPVGFGPVPLEGRLVVGSDGLFKYCQRRRLLLEAMRSPLGVAATALVNAVRLPSGNLQDDIALVLCERRMDHRN